MTRPYSAEDFVAIFWTRVDRSAGPDSCWPWLAHVNTHGYGHASVGGGRETMAHRRAYELVVGPIAEGLELDHLCRNPACVNPAHLEPVTHRENILRSPTAPPALASRRTECPQGHAYTAENIYWDGPRREHRRCRTCHKARVKARYWSRWLDRRFGEEPGPGRPW